MNSVLTKLTGDGVGLALEGVTFSIGDLRILTGVSMECRAGQVTGLLGPNGAGKTTLLNCISGLYRATGGRIAVDHCELQQRRCYQVAREGVGRTFQTPQVVEELSVVENVMLGAQARAKQRLFRDSLALFWRGAQEHRLRSTAQERLELVGLSEAASKPVAACNHIERRLIEVARALCSEPRILLLDEPCAGMGEDGRAVLADLLRKLAEKGMTILLVEHDVKFVTNVSDQIAVLDRGSVIAQGLPKEVIANPLVIAAYLGR